MAFFFSPIGNTQTLDANGDPLVGGTISTFLAGTSTPRTTYTDDTGGTAQGVVMTLNSLGYPTNGPVWLQSGVPLKFIIKNALGVTQSTFDDVSGIGDNSNVTDEWLLFGAAPTYISATSFSLVGDQTNTFQINRRLKSTNTGGTVYSTINNSAFAAGITTVTVTNTSGVLDSGLSAVSYGLLSVTNDSMPRGIFPTFAEVNGGYVYLREEQPTNTAGGGFTQGAYVLRVLNTEVVDTAGVATLAANQVTLQPGTYRFRASAPGYAVDAHKCKLRNITDAIDYIGSSEQTSSAGAVTTRSQVSGRFTIGAPKTFGLYHRCSSTKTVNGLGSQSNFSDIEVYSEVEFWKEV